MTHSETQATLTCYFITIVHCDLLQVLVLEVAGPVSLEAQGPSEEAPLPPQCRQGQGSMSGSVTSCRTVTLTSSARGPPVGVWTPALTMLTRADLPAASMLTARLQGTRPSAPAQRLTQVRLPRPTAR